MGRASPVAYQSCCCLCNLRERGTPPGTPALTRVVLAACVLQMALARSDSAGQLFSGPVVVLSDKDKEEMDGIVSLLVL